MATTIHIFEIKEDGLYVTPDGSQYQFKKGQVLGKAFGAALKKVGPFPVHVSSDIRAMEADALANKKDGEPQGKGKK